MPVGRAARPVTGRPASSAVPPVNAFWTGLTGPSWVEAVTGVRHGLDPAGMVWVGLDPAADPADVLGDRVGILPFRRRVPNVGEQLLAGEDLAGGGGEEGQQVELP